MLEPSREELVQKALEEVQKNAQNAQYFTEVALPGVKPDDVNFDELSQS